MTYKTRQARLNDEDFLIHIAVVWEESVYRDVLRFYDDHNISSSWGTSVYDSIKVEMKRGSKGTLTLNMSGKQNDRENMLELATDILSTGNIQHIFYFGLEAEEITTLTQGCIDQGVVISEQDMTKEQEIPLSHSHQSFSNSVAEAAMSEGRNPELGGDKIEDGYIIL